MTTGDGVTVNINKCRTLLRDFQVFCDNNLGIKRIFLSLSSWHLPVKSYSPESKIVFLGRSTINITFPNVHHVGWCWYIKLKLSLLTT